MSFTRVGVVLTSSNALRPVRHSLLCMVTVLGNMRGWGSRPTNICFVLKCPFVHYTSTRIGSLEAWSRWSFHVSYTSHFLSNRWREVNKFVEIIGTEAESELNFFLMFAPVQGTFNESLHISSGSDWQKSSSSRTALLALSETHWRLKRI